MTEVEALNSLTEMAEASLSFITVWISVTLAYLTASYLVGKALSRFQYLAVTALYVAITFVMTMASVTWIKAWEALHMREPTILREVVISNYAFANTIIGVFIFGTALSLYFMYNVRRSKEM
jgi:hypothetical protein